MAPYLPGLSDVAPEVLAISFPRGYNPLLAKSVGITPKSSPEGLRDFGMTEVENPYGNTVCAYDTEHMLCDTLGGTVSPNLQLLLPAMSHTFHQREGPTETPVLLGEAGGH